MLGKDITNERFGKLVAIRIATEEEKPKNNKRKTNYWFCQCDCGNTCIKAYKDLKTRTKSCGCLQKETIRSNRVLDISGQRFGKLTAIKDTGKICQNGHIWECLCDCGNTVEHTPGELNTGDYFSCRCLKESKMEFIFQDILDSRFPEIKYQKQVTFDDLKYKKPLKFDFLLTINGVNVIIELDGIQHYTPENKWYNKDAVQRDQIKNDWALLHKIKLFRIKYTLNENFLIDYLKHLSTLDYDWLKENSYVTV